MSEYKLEDVGQSQKKKKKLKRKTNNNVADLSACNFNADICISYFSGHETIFRKKKEIHCVVFWLMLLFESYLSYEVDENNKKTILRYSMSIKVEINRVLFQSNFISQNAVFFQRVSLESRWPALWFFYVKCQTIYVYYMYIYLYVPI